jgi:hypothetical protein
MKPRAMKRGGAKKMMRGGMAEKPMMMKAGGTPTKGGKVKKMRAGGGSMSSASLGRRMLEDSIARERNIERTYADRGTVGSRKTKEEVDREIREYAKDAELLETYGRDAPNARSFNTRRATGAPSAKRAAGGKVKKMQAGGKLKMVEKNGKKVPAFAADGVGKMKRGGATKKMMRGGMAGKPMMMKRGGMAKKK